VVAFPGQRSTGPRRIGFLESGGGSTSVALEPFREGMRDLGHVEGQNLIIEHRDADVSVERLPGLAAELVGVPVEIIVASNAPTALAASRATSTIPIVAAGGNVVAAGLVSNIARPEGNVTGVATNSLEVIGKWIELLKEAVPSISRLAAVQDRRGPAAEPDLQQVQRAAQSLQIQLTTFDLRDLDQLSAVLSMVKANGADGLVVMSGGVFRGGNDPRIGGEALNSRLPAVAELRDFAVNGGLLAHGPNTHALARRSASYVDRILKGAKPGDLPIELPTEFNIVVNLKTAGALGIMIPQSVVARAHEVIQ
jgi:putative tryptophan/tyrosine transport system substrate-binding protein